MISFILSYITVPLVVVLFYLFDKTNRKTRRRQMLAVKFAWYIILAILMAISYFNGKDLSKGITGYTLAIALFEGIPGLFEVITDHNE